MTIEKTKPSELGLVENAVISVLHTEGDKNGQTFNGKLLSDIEIGQPIHLDLEMEISGNISSIEEHDGSGIYFKATDESAGVITITKPA